MTKSRSQRIIPFVLCLIVLTITIIGTPVNIHAVSNERESMKITFTKKKTTIVAGKTYTYKVKVSETNDSVSWSVSNKKVATISKAGKLTAKRAGKVIVTAKAGTAKASVNVTVKGKQVIAIDPGHQRKGDSSTEAIGPGSKTKKAKVASGTSGVASKVPEYKLTLAVSLKLREELWNRGYEVVMTRDKNDVNISNKERALLANESGADICIRIHADGSTNQSVSGASVLYPSSKNPYVSNLSKASKELAKEVITSYCKATQAKNRGMVARDDLTGTNWSTIPVIVLEIGFMSNPTEDKKMQTKAYQDKIVDGICNGIDAYFG